MFSKLLLSVGVVAVLTAAPASAATIFSDDFNRTHTSDTVGNNWTEIEDNQNDVAIVHVTGANGDDQLKLSGNLNGSGIDAGVAQLNALNVGNSTSLTLSFIYKGLNTESSDKLNVQWAYDNTNIWTDLQTTPISLTNTSSFTTETLAFNVLANSNINIRLWTDVSEGQSGDNEGAYIDNLVLSSSTTSGGGNESTTPLPAALPLFAGGLGVMGVLARRKKRKTSENIAAA